MKAYSFTDSDLRSLAIANIVTSFAFATFAALATFIVDVNKDIAFSDTPTAEAVALQGFTNWIGIPLGIILFSVGIASWVFRGNTINQVKRESENAE